MTAKKKKTEQYEYLLIVNGDEYCITAENPQKAIEYLYADAGDAANDFHPGNHERVEVWMNCGIYDAECARTVKVSKS